MDTRGLDSAATTKNLATSSLQRWVDRITSSPRDTPIEELAAYGRELLHSGEERFDPVQLRVIRRIIARTERSHRQPYTDRPSLLADLHLLMEESNVPPSRRTLVHTLTTAIERAHKGAATITALSGPSGIGKTYLWRVVANSVPESDSDHIYYKVPQSGVRSFTPIAEILRALLRSDNAPPPGGSGFRDADIKAVINGAQITPALARTVLQILVADRMDTRVHENERDAAISVSQIVRAFASLLRSALSRGAPTTVAIDDIQWIDRESLAVLTQTVIDGGGFAILLIGRPEIAARIGSNDSIQWLTVAPLTAHESLQLLAASSIPESDALLSPRITEWAVQRAQGNPFTLVETARTLRQQRTLEEEPPPDSNAGSLALRFHHLSPASRLVVGTVAILSPPVREDVLYSLPTLTRHEVATARDEAISAGFLTIDRDAGTITFPHDQIETGVRDAVVTPEHTKQPDTTVVTAISLLASRAEEGDTHYQYVLTRYLANSETPRPIQKAISDVLSVEACVGHLWETAQRMIAVYAATEAFTCLVALESLLKEIDPHLDSAAERVGIDLTRVYEIGHYAAYLTDDGAAMSRYYTRLSPRIDSLPLNRLRELWITRCFAKLWVRGAWHIGWRILADLDAVPIGEAAWRRFTNESRWRLRVASIRRILRAASGAGRDPSEEERIIGRTVVRLFLSAMSIDTGSLFNLAWILLRNVSAYGLSAETLMGLVYWISGLAVAGGSPRKLVRLKKYARKLLAIVEERSTWDAVDHMSIVYSSIFFSGRLMDASTSGPRFLGLFNDGVSGGDYEGAGHAISLYCQWLLQSGYPLQDVYDAMDAYRRVLSSLGQNRTALSITKYQQAVEVLLGETAEPLTLTGTLCRDDEMEARLRGASDTLALAGFYQIRGFVASFHDAPEAVLIDLQRTESRNSLLAFMFDVNGTAFFTGMAAARCKRWRVLDEAIDALAPYRHGPAARHRYLALIGERAFHRGAHRRARQLLYRAVSVATGNGYLHEAALVAERHGVVYTDPERLVFARGAYAEWGARRAVDRVDAAIRSLAHHPPVAIPIPSLASLVGPAASPEDAPGAGRTPRPEFAPRHQIEQTRQYLLLLFATIPDSLMLLRVDGTILLRNTSAERYAVAHPDESERLSEEIGAVLLPVVRQAIAGGVQHEVDRVVGNRTLTITATPAPLEARGGEAAVVVRDVTVSRERDRQLIVADRMTSLGMLAATVAHEVSNPNHIIHLNAEALKMLLNRSDYSAGAAVGSDARRYSHNANRPASSDAERAALTSAVDNVLDGARRIDAVVRQIVEYGRGGRQHEWNELNPVEICNRVIRFTRLLVTGTSGGITFIRHEPLPKTRGVRALVEQALINLVKNASEATQSSDQEIAVRVDARDKWLVFAVCDQGHGFAEDTGVPTTAFVTTRANEGGGGLGLSIVRSIAEIHHGRLEFSHDDRYATIAEFLIPIESFS